MVSGSEVSHFVAQSEAVSHAKDATQNTRHHEQTELTQRLFMDKVNKLTQVIRDLGDPFQEERKDLLILDTKDIAHPTDSDPL